MSGQMVALVKETASAGAVMKQVPIPSTHPDEVLIRVKATSVCGTDLHIYNWDHWAQSRVKPPYVFGHECSGIVAEVGEKVTDVEVGDPVSCETHIVCGKCPACRRGDFHICYHTQIIGVDRAGCFAEYLAIPASNVWKVPKTMPFDIATLMEPMGNAVHTVLSGPVVGKRVAVVGCGPIGIMAVSIAKAAGAFQVIALDVNPTRLQLAEQMGATHLINSSQEDPVALVRNMTEDHGVDVVLEMSGHPTAIRQGFAMCTYGGRISMLGLPAQDVPINIADEIVFKGITIHGITGRKMFETWEQTAGLLASGQVDLEPLITHRLPLSEFERGFELMRAGDCGKVVFSIPE